MGTFTEKHKREKTAERIESISGLSGMRYDNESNLNTTRVYRILFKGGIILVQYNSPCLYGLLVLSGSIPIVAAQAVAHVILHFRK